jgi:hypothetical protein
LGITNLEQERTNSVFVELEYDQTTFEKTFVEITHADFKSGTIVVSERAGEL